MTHFHFVGIKGAGMSSLAQIMHDLGHKVQGSDIKNYVFTEIALKNKGIEILPFDADNIKEDMNMYQNPKVVVVLMHDIKAKSVEELPQIIEYFSSLGYKFGILN